jgi:hypothetical protein
MIKLLCLMLDKKEDFMISGIVRIMLDLIRKMM